MSNLFGDLTTEGLEEAQDRIGGGYKALETDVYTGKIKAAYAGKAASSNAQSVTIILEVAGNEYRETFWITNKSGQNFYLDKNDSSKKNPLPGFTIVDDICLVTTNKHLSAMSAQEKVMNIWDADAKAEVPKSVPMLVELLGKEVTLGILKEIRNKQKKDSSGSYVDTDETREENVTDKVFHYPSNLTVVEAKKGIQNPAFYPAWVERNKGKDRDRTNKNAIPGSAGRPLGGPPKAAEASAKTVNLFGGT